MTGWLMMPWAPEARLYCAPKRLLFTLALGEDPDLPSRAPVLAGMAQPAQKTGHGALDRILGVFGGNVRLARLHSPANQASGFDLTEHASGMSRTYVASFSDYSRIDQAADALRQLAVVTSASADYFVVSSDVPLSSTATEAPESWPWDMIGANRRASAEFGDPAITTAVLDTGAARRHAEISGRLSSGFDTVNFAGAELAQGLSLVGDYGTRDTDPDESNNPHGTACLALIGGNGHGMPQGLATQTSLMPVRVLASARTPRRGNADNIVGVGALSDIDCGIKRAVDLGAKVLNCSFGTAESAISPGDPMPHADTTAYALARGTIVVAASGNSGKRERYHPSAAEGVISVGSVGPDGKPSQFSTTGDHVALSAPGEAIRTPHIEGYQLSTGTSFAAPFVAGAAALLVARARRGAQPMDGPKARDILTATARPFDTPTRGSGAGILNLPAALAAVDRLSAHASTLGKTPLH